MSANNWRFVFDTNLTLDEARNKLKHLLAPSNAAPHYTGSSGYNFFPAHMCARNKSETDGITITVSELNGKIIIVLRKVYILTQNPQLDYSRFDEVFVKMDKLLSCNFSKR